jgi:hypothetical protein
VFVRFRGWGWAVLAALLACASSDESAAPAAVACPAVIAGEDIAVADMAVHVETGGDPALELVRADVQRYLEALWGAPVVVASGVPDFSKRVTLWLHTAADAPTNGFSMKREGAVLSVAASDKRVLAHAAYAFLEELGVRFFHPKEEFVPHLGAPVLPKALDVQRRSQFALRGVQLHLLHPLEYFEAFNGYGAEGPDFEDAKRFIDWLVKTGQNHVQWPLLETVDFEAWRPRVQAIMDYAHLRGVTVGASVQTWGGAALQNNFVLVKDVARWQEQMDAQLDRLLSLGWDVVELALGEFLDADPHALLEWLDHAVAHVASTHPNVQVNVQNHVGNFQRLYVPFDGQTVFYYHLPKYADARLGQSVHTLYFFDLFRDWAMYNHPDFHLQRDFLFEMLAKSERRVNYFPESAYWISADVDVPLFLPEFIHARWIDIHGLSENVKAAGLRPINGHLMFSSGHEWGYWMTDYLAAKMLWEPEAPLDRFFAHYGAIYGACAADVTKALSEFTALQTEYLFDRRLVAYVSGEDTLVELGYLAGIPTHPQREAFEKVLNEPEAERAAFERDVVLPLEEFARKIRPREDAIDARCRAADATLLPWCLELRDGMRIVRLRSEHASHLYRAVLAKGSGKDGAPELERAVHVTENAREVILGREEHYRFDRARLTDARPNPTIYPFGYLRQAHTQCFYFRREEQVRQVLENGAGPSIINLPRCLD